MNRLFPIFLFLFCVALLAAGCGKLSVDNTDPEIEVFALNGSDQLDELVVPATLSLDVLISDDEQLQEVLVRVDNISNPALSDELKRLYFQIFGNIEGRFFEEMIYIGTDSETRAGLYELRLQVTDANGNANSRVRQFVIRNAEEQPQVNVTGFSAPVIDDAVVLNTDGSLTLEGAITDNNALAQFTVELSGAQNLHSETEVLDDAVYTDYDLGWLGAIQIPANALLGDYTYSVTAIDSDGHMTFYTQAVVVE